MPRIFLSAPRDAVQLAQWLGSQIAALGGEVWWHLEKLVPGDLVWRKIEDALLGCDAAIIVLGGDGWSSPFQAEEIERIAREQASRPGFRVVPVGSESAMARVRESRWSHLADLQWLVVENQYAAPAAEDRLLRSGLQHVLESIAGEKDVSSDAVSGPGEYVSAVEQIERDLAKMRMSAPSIVRIVWCGWLALGSLGLSSWVGVMFLQRAMPGWLLVGFFVGVGFFVWLGHAFVVLWEQRESARRLASRLEMLLDDISASLDGVSSSGTSVAR